MCTPFVGENIYSGNLKLAKLGKDGEWITYKSSVLSNIGSEYSIYVLKGTFKVLTILWEKRGDSSFRRSVGVFITLITKK